LVPDAKLWDQFENIPKGRVTVRETFGVPHVQ
jgi:hypothetical protein